MFILICLRVIRSRERKWLKAIELIESQHFQEAYEILQVLS